MNCDAIARHYRWMELAVFGNALEQCRTRFLPELADARRALVLGDGDGRFLARLLNACPKLHADYVDRSGAMLDLAVRRVGHERVKFYCTDALTEHLPQSEYDLVSAHFFFDCFERDQLDHVIRRVVTIAPNARWIVSEFRVPDGWLALPSRMLISVMYRFFGLAARLKTRGLTDHRPLMEAAGLRSFCREERAGGLLVSEIWAPTA